MRNIRLVSTEIKYRCLRCGRISTAKAISTQVRFQCPHCGFTILEKVRREFANEVLAR